MKKLTKYALLLAAMLMGFAFTSCQQDSGDNTPAVKYYTVTFNSNGGTEVKSQKVESGKKATKPADPTKTETKTEAFVFAGWYTSTDGGSTLSDTAFDFDTAITKDITLYAKWKVANYIILKDCSAIKAMFEALCDCTPIVEGLLYKYNKTITQFKKADAKPASAEYYLDAAGKRIPLWYDEGTTTLYYYLEAGKKMSLRTSDNKNSLFAYMEGITYIDTSDFDTSKVTCMNNMFTNCKNLTNLDVSKFDTSKVTCMNCMFANCENLTNLDVSKFDTSKVTDMGSMFQGCSNLTNLDVSKFDTSKVTDMEHMFYSCRNLTNLDVSNFDTSKVTNMRCMFDTCSSLTTLDVSKFDTSKVTDMLGMFWNCSSLTSLDVSKFDTSNVTSMYSMFKNCEKLNILDVSSFDTSKVTDMRSMFANCFSLTTIFASDKFVTNGVTSDSNMFQYAYKLQGGAGTTYSNSNIDKTYARIDVAGTPGYFTRKQ